jgi:hypothetical protein
MTSSVRYKHVENKLGVALTKSNFPYTTDGDDKQFKVIKRIVADADVGVGAGQLGNALGAILDVIPSTVNVLWVLGFVHRPDAAVGGVTPYINLIGKAFPIPTPLTQVNLEFALGLDNTIRAIDVGQGGTAAIISGDIITAILILGPKVDFDDTMN